MRSATVLLRTRFVGVSPAVGSTLDNPSRFEDAYAVVVILDMVGLDVGTALKAGDAQDPFARTAEMMYDNEIRKIAWLLAIPWESNS